jgi:hypothetical protein
VRLIEHVAIVALAKVRYAELKASELDIVVRRTSSIEV